MAVGTYAPDAFFQRFDTNGNPLNGGKLETYIAGTSTPVATYSDVGLTTPNANPVILDSAGFPTSGAIFLTPGVSYKFILKTSAGVTVATRDNIAAVPLSAASVDITGTAGETITAGQAVYLSDGSGGKTPGLWYKADSTNTFSSITNLVGMAPTGVTSGSSGTFRIEGSVTGLSSLTVGADYFVGVAGAITTTPPTNRAYLGKADTTTSLVLARPTTLTEMIGTLTAGNGIVITTAGTGITIASNSYVIDRDVTATVTSSSSAETTVYSFSVPGNTLGTSRMLRVTWSGQCINTTGGNVNFTVRFKYGATTVQSGTVSILDPSTSSVSGEFYLSNQNASNAQRGWGQIRTTSTAGAATMQAILNHFVGEFAAAEDSTASKNLVITFQSASASANFTSSMFVVQTELV